VLTRVRLECAECGADVPRTLPARCPSCGSTRTVPARYLNALGTLLLLLWLALGVVVTVYLLRLVV
jgi:hypothetical protein